MKHFSETSHGVGMGRAVQPCGYTFPYIVSVKPLNANQLTLMKDLHPHSRMHIIIEYRDGE